MYIFSAIFTVFLSLFIGYFVIYLQETNIMLKFYQEIILNVRLTYIFLFVLITIVASLLNQYICPILFEPIQDLLVFKLLLTLFCLIFSYGSLLLFVKIGKYVRFKQENYTIQFEIISKALIELIKKNNKINKSYIYHDQLSNLFECYINLVDSNLEKISNFNIESNLDYLTCFIKKIQVEKIPMKVDIIGLKNLAIKINSKYPEINIEKLTNVINNF